MALILEGQKHQKGADGNDRQGLNETVAWLSVGVYPVTGSCWINFSDTGANFSMLKEGENLLLPVW